jgi:hypothetical protein
MGCVNFRVTKSGSYTVESGGRLTILLFPDRDSWQKAPFVAKIMQNSKILGICFIISCAEL